MPLRVDDPELLAKAADLKAVGYKFSDQHDLRIRWLELELNRLAETVARLEHRLDREAEQLGDGLERLELKIEGEQPELDLA